VIKRLSGPPVIDRRAAFRAQRADVLNFCASLGPADWRMDSRAEGWSITDVVAHMGAGCHAMFSPAVFTIMRAEAVEQVNDQLVDARRDRTPSQVLGEYRRWSRVFGTSIRAMTGTPLARVQIPLGDLGRFPIRLLPSAVVFDHHTHLTHDIAPALGRQTPAVDANRMAAVLEWMMAVLSNQLAAAKPAGFDLPLSITLSGPGGGSWSVTAAPGESEMSRITAVAAEFPEWATQRADWRDRDVRIDGDLDYAAAFLDWMNII
jgi:uncharacterized protein (TIGR03083 family)